MHSALNMQLTSSYMFMHTYAVGVVDIAAREGSPHNVLHLSSTYSDPAWDRCHVGLAQACPII